MFEIPADIRINTVNCVGVMGAGLALAFKTKYPDMFRDYQKACKTGEVKPGKLHVSKKLFGDWIINFPTKRHWREPSRYADIEAGLIALRKYLVEQGKVKVLLPAVGCGHGGLEWSRISEMIKKQLADLEAEIVVFTPSDSRAAGDKIKDHDDKLAQDRLDAEGIITVDPGDDLFPIPLRGRTAAKLYIKGDPQKLNLPLLTILPSMKPTQHEIDATATAIESIMRPGITLLVGYGATIERPAMKKALEKGADVVVFLAEGILGFQVRKDLLDVWDENRIVVISLTKPLERWSPSTSFRAKDLQLSLASVAIITDPEPQPISKMLLQKASQKLPPIYYIDYGKKDENIINTFKKIKAQNLVVNDLSNPSYFEVILNILGYHEPTQPISEKYAETITAPIAEHLVTNESETRSIEGSEVHANQGTAYPKRLIEVDLPI
ncbi:MAG: macro domain-containing protein, partial [Syntrophales bacterium]